MATHALVVQGGGMRSIYSMGALQALEEAGVKDSYDLVIGSSAGALNLGYFVSGEAYAGTAAYLKYLTGRQFVRRRHGLPYADIDYLMDVVVRQRTLPGLVQSISGNRSDFVVGLTKCPEGMPSYVNLSDTATVMDPYQVLKASVALPVLYGRRIPLFGSYFVDGGVIDPLPVVEAIVRGASHLTVISTRPFGQWNNREPRLSRAAVRIWPDLDWGVRSAILSPNVLLFSAMRAKEDSNTSSQREVRWIAPSNPKLVVGRLETSVARLSAFAKLGYDDCVRALESNGI